MVMVSDGLHRHTPELSGGIVVRVLSLDSSLSPHVADAITSLTNVFEWLEVGDTVDDVIAAASVIVADYYENMLVGSVFPWLVDPPGGWLLLDGSTYAQSDYPELFGVLPSHLISGTNFTLPDVSDAFPYGVQSEGNGSAVSGSNDLVLTIGQLPAHTHNYIPSPLGITPGLAGPAAPAAVPAAPIATTATGSGDTIDKRPLRFGLVYAVFAGRV